MNALSLSTAFEVQLELRSDENIKKIDIRSPPIEKSDYQSVVVQI